MATGRAMADFLYSIDRSIFYFCNQTLSNPLFDVLMPFLTNLTTTWYGQSVFGLLWLLLMWKGGKKGRVLGILLIPLLVMSDQLSSSIIKNIVARPRPCHTVNGVPVLDHVRLLVDCGPGFSFPSSHAVNSFAAGFFISYYVRRWTWLCMLIASVMSFSRVSVGVHYPSDVLGGAIIGGCCACFFISIINGVLKKFPRLEFRESLSP